MSDTRAATAHVVLVGMMGAGKTAVGRALAVRLGRQFGDTDELLETSAKCTVREFFERYGEAAFRSAEGLVLDAALNVAEPSVIGCGGGIVTTAANRRLLRNGNAFVVWLRADDCTLRERIGDPGGRPLLDGDPEERIASLAAERASLYGEVADLVVDVDRRAVGQVVDAIVAEVAT